MDTPFISKYSSSIFAWVICALVMLLIVLEGWRYIEKPSIENKNQIIASELEEGAALFIKLQENLAAQSQKLASALKVQVEQNDASSELFKTLQEFPEIWGAGLFRVNQPLVWDGFSLDIFRSNPFPNRMEDYIKVEKQGNVTYWLCHVGFYLQTGNGQIPYHLFTAKRIEQTNALPFASEREYSILGHASGKNLYPVTLGIYNPLPDKNTDYRILQTISKDSVGIIYAANSRFEDALEQWHVSNQFWRSVFALLCFIVISVLLYAWVDKLPAWKSLILQLFIISIAWLVFDYIDISEHWIPIVFDDTAPDLVTSYKDICNFLIRGFFFLLIAFTVHQKIKRESLLFHPTWFLRSIFAAFFTGVINVAAITCVLHICYVLARTTSIPLLTLEVLPGAATLLFYLVLGIMLLALTIGLLSLNQFLFRSCRSQLKLVSAICISSFLIGLFIAQLFVPETFSLNWAFILSIIYFAIIFTLSFTLFIFPRIIKRSSPLRNAAIYSLILSIVGSTLIYQAKMDSKDTTLAAVKKTYSKSRDDEAEQLTTDILSQLGQAFQSINESDLETRTSFIQARFTQTIENNLKKAASIYSFDLQLIRSDSQLIADYSTDLNSPDWVNVFDLQRLSITMNILQITRNTVRPIVQQPDLINSEDYQTFYRGWIPIFGQNETEPIAWILCSVYQERPNFNKPIRAVMASISYREWNNSYSIQQYNNNRLTQTVYQGVGDNYPVYNVLLPAEQHALENDSTIYYTSSDNQNTYRNLLARQPQGLDVKITTLLPGYQSILFSFFRLSFTLLIVGFVMVMAYQFIKTRKIIFFGENERFQYRILDSFLLATLVFLVMLVFATHIAIKRQNSTIVKQQLLEELESITTTTEKNETIRRNLSQGTGFSLDSLTAPLDVDASLYAEGVIKKSTTPQIYQQHLLPSSLPFPVYLDLFQVQKRNALTTVKLDDQDLLIGYRSVLDDDGTPLAAIAIPTFIQSPKYNKQLLETTSYLIILYLIIFGLFILGTTIISRQLTRPLHYIQQGLNKISKGDLDTIIPATSKDEIGSLAKAYNQMVGRLKDLQEELAATEREAAWKEMAQQVAHEIKNPLTPMKLNIQHLQRQLASGKYDREELKQKIASISENMIVQIQSLSNIASDFSKFSKPIEEEFSEININSLMHSVIDLYKYDGEINISTDCKAFPATVFGAQDELRRTIINLIKNAREAMPNGGTIFLKTYVRGKSMFIEIEDNGDGISEEDKTKIFVPNFSTKSSGTGLGLAICKKVVEEHEGSISFASIKGLGTTFIIKLPLYKD